jgi:hypothetical protein
MSKRATSGLQEVTGHNEGSKRVESPSRLKGQVRS